MANRTVYLDGASDDLAAQLCKEQGRSLSNLVQHLINQEWLSHMKLDDGWGAVREYIENPEKVLAESEPLEKVKKELGL